MSGLPSLVQQLKEPAYIHVLLNPLPIYGLLLGSLALIAALVCRSRAAQILALGLILFSAASAWPVYAIGQRAYTRIYKVSDADGQAFLDNHKRRAERVIYLFLALAGTASIALLLAAKSRKAALPLTWIALLLAVVTLGITAWTAWPGGKIRHPEFRPETNQLNTTLR